MKPFILTLILALVSTGSFAECIKGCSNVLVALPKPVIREQVIVVEVPKNEKVTVKTCVERNGECQPVDERSGFYSVVTSTEVE